MPVYNIGNLIRLYLDIPDLQISFIIVNVYDGLQITAADATGFFYFHIRKP
jgi:hypothetical protein